MLQCMQSAFNIEKYRCYTFNVERWEKQWRETESTGGTAWVAIFSSGFFITADASRKPPSTVLHWNPFSLIRWKNTRCLWSILCNQWHPLKSRGLRKLSQGGWTCPQKNMPVGYLPWTCRACTHDTLISFTPWYIFNRASRSPWRTVHQCPHLIGFSLPPAS